MSRSSLFHTNVRQPTPAPPAFFFWKAGMKRNEVEDGGGLNADGFSPNPWSERGPLSPFHPTTSLCKAPAPECPTPHLLSLSPLLPLGKTIQLSMNTRMCQGGHSKYIIYMCREQPCTRCSLWGPRVSPFFHSVQCQGPQCRCSIFHASLEPCTGWKELFQTLMLKGDPWASVYMNDPCVFRLVVTNASSIKQLDGEINGSLHIIFYTGWWKRGDPKSNTAFLCVAVFGSRGHIWHCRSYILYCL